MALSNHDQARIRKYLLGHLSDEEQEKIEERLMVEDDLFEELEISKGEVIEEYCAGELTENEHRWFERHYLSTPEGKKRHTFTRALDCLPRTDPAPQPAHAPQSIAPLLRIASFFQTYRWAIAVVLSIAFVGAIQLGLRSRWGPQSALILDLNNSVATRSTADRNRQIQLKPNIEQVKIYLRLPQSAVRGTSYRAELDNRTESESLKPTEHDEKSVLVVIPAAQLPPGAYELTLYAIQPDGSEQRIQGEYRFEITN